MNNYKHCVRKILFNNNNNRYNYFFILRKNKIITNNWLGFHFQEEELKKTII